MNAESYVMAVSVFVLIPVVLLIPFCYAAFTYSPEEAEPLTRWKFAFVSLFLTYGVAVFIGVLFFPIEAAALKLSHQLEIDGWLKTAALLQGFSDLSQLVWLAVLLSVGLAMPSRIRKMVTTIRNHEDTS